MNENEDEDDFNLPATPYTSDIGDDFVDPSTVKADALPVSINTDDVKDSELTDLEKKLFLNEMECYDMYLNNLHAGFKAATSVNSIIKLVQTAVGVHRYRRHVFKEQMEASKPKKIIEFDNMGRPKKVNS